MRQVAPFCGGRSFGRSAFPAGAQISFPAASGAGALRKAGAAVGNLAAWRAAACIACAGRVPSRVARGPEFCSGARSGPLGGTKKRGRGTKSEFWIFLLSFSLYGFLLLSLLLSLFCFLWYSLALSGFSLARFLFPLFVFRFGSIALALALALFLWLSI